VRGRKGAGSCALRRAGAAASSVTITDIENKLTDLCGNLLLQNDVKNTLCETSSRYNPEVASTQYAPTVGQV
jgi:hypothetical protein